MNSQAKLIFGSSEIFEEAFDHYAELVIADSTALSVEHKSNLLRYASSMEAGSPTAPSGVGHESPQCETEYLFLDPTLHQAQPEPDLNDYQSQSQTNYYPADLYQRQQQLKPLRTEQIQPANPKVEQHHPQPWTYSFPIKSEAQYVAIRDADMRAPVERPSDYPLDQEVQQQYIRLLMNSFYDLDNVLDGPTAKAQIASGKFPAEEVEKACWAVMVRILIYSSNIYPPIYSADNH